MKPSNTDQVELVDRALAALATEEGTRRLRQHFAASNGGGGGGGGVDGGGGGGGVGLDDLTMAFVELRRRALAH